MDISHGCKTLHRSRLSGSCQRSTNFNPIVSFFFLFYYLNQKSVDISLADSTIVVVVVSQLLSRLQSSDLGIDNRQKRKKITNKPTVHQSQNSNIER